MTVGENIKRVRKEKGMTQKRLGELCGINEANIRKYELGKANPKKETIQKIATALGVSTNELLDWKDIPEIVDYVYSSILTDLIDMLPDKRYNLSNNEQKQFISKINAYVAEGNKIENLDEREAYFFNAIAIISHELLDHLLKPYLKADIIDIVDLLSYYLSFRDNKQAMILELLSDLDDNSYVHRKDDE